MTMSKVIISLLLLILLVNQVTHILGKLTTIRTTFKISPIKVTCISEDDGSALVWNANSKYEEQERAIIDTNAKQFDSKCNSFGDKLDCEMNDPDSCLSAWRGESWKLTNSMDTPMGSVFDRRWEAFKEYVLPANNTKYIPLNNIKTIVLPFSIRAERDVHILICREQENNFCYWIILGGWGNKQSVIRKCPEGVPPIGSYPKKNEECAKTRAIFEHTALAEYEWRNFVLMWNSQTRKLLLYDQNQLILRYTDTDEYNNENYSYKLSVRCAVEMSIRYHIYNYFYTDTPNAILTSNAFDLNANVTCLQMLIGLCAACDADILLRNTISNNILQTKTVTGSSVATVHGLPMWQAVKIMVNSMDSYDSLKIEVHPKFNFRNINPVWAIASVRQCLSKGCFRKSQINIVEYWSYKSKRYFFPKVTCQKLFYEEQSVVQPLDNMNNNVELDDENCTFEDIGLSCPFDCRSKLISEIYCKNIVICYENGCTCSSGYTGPNCGVSCKYNFYGRACKEKCGMCKDVTCNIASGKCPYGCMNTANRIYASPFCKIGIGRPDEIQIISTNQTAIAIKVPFKWENKYEGIELLYSFKIETQSETITKQSSWKRMFQNTTELLVIFIDLQSDTTYFVVPIFSFAGAEISGNWQSVDTNCDVRVYYMSTISAFLCQQLYPCSMNSYEVQFINNDDQNQKLPTKRKIKSFPHTISSLTPYTFYNVTIWYKNKHLFGKEVRTLEGVPSKVAILHVMPLSSSEVNLLWTEPVQPKGVIKEYVIYLKVAEYLGCQDYDMPTLSNDMIVEKTNKTEITLFGLHPYAKYDMEVRANNSRYLGKPAKETFSLGASAKVAVTFTQLKITKWTLSWSRPEDCTNILGPISIARIEIQGISEAIKNFSTIKNTTNSYKLNVKDFLYGAEQYVVKIFALRDKDLHMNSPNYIEIEFETPPKEPPNVINLEVVEIDGRKTNRQEIQLRWQNPRPPLNGILNSYSIILCGNRNSRRLCVDIPVQLHDLCDLWDDYICKTFLYSATNIQVVVYNKNVPEASPGVSVSQEMLLNTTPDAPRNFTLSVGNNSVVDLEWFHPWRTARRLDYFNVTISEISSELRGRTRRSIESRSSKLFVTDYMRNYSMQLYLLPSTQYNLSINSVTIENKISNTITLNVRTPSTIDFTSNLTSDVDESDSTIAVNIPHIVNVTRISTLYIIVKGSHPCDNYSQPNKSLWEQADIKEQDIAWQAVAVPASSASGKVFTLGSKDTYGNATNCPLKSGVPYDITVIISEPNFSNKPFTITRKISISIGDPSHPESWIIPILIIIVMVAAVGYFYRRKQQKSNKQLILQDEMALSQNIETYEHDTKSVISDSKQASTPSDRQSLSRATTPEVSTTPIAIENNDDGKEVTSLVKVKDFEDYVRPAIESGLLDKQYETFSRGQTQPWDYGKLPQNKSKNRYGNLIAYDETRVILKKLPDDAYSDYINANYITGYKKKKRYIATQGPKPNTVVDFWRMIWQEKVLIICMLANVVENGKTKCEQYWPDIGKKKKYGEIVVLNATHNVFADYCFRTFHVTHEKETRKVEHLHYTAWPDHGVPMYTHSVITYLKKLLATPPGDGPVVVHCSAGVGRTGTIVLCDICLHRAAAEGVVDVFAETASIRRERANMVDNKQQYLLAHLALVECLLSIPTTLPCNETLPSRIKELKKQLPMQLQRLQNTAWQDEALRPITSPHILSEKNLAKNRYPELISDKVSRIYLKRYPTSDEDSDYLSGVYVDGVRLQNQYLATQLPMPSTINDFWRMIAELKVELIVMLQPPDPNDSTCCSVAPASGEFKPTPYLNITAKEIVESESYTSQKLLLVDSSEKPSREQSVTILCCTEWKSGRNHPPPSVMTMVTFWQATERIARCDGPTVILCQDGVTGCGLYLALSFMLERMAVERECDVCLAVRAVRRSRPDFVQSLEHLEYLYDAAMTYLEYFETYANFS